MYWLVPLDMGWHMAVWPIAFTVRHVIYAMYWLYLILFPPLCACVSPFTLIFSFVLSITYEKKPGQRKNHLILIVFTLFLVEIPKIHLNLYSWMLTFHIPLPCTYKHRPWVCIVRGPGMLPSNFLSSGCRAVDPTVHLGTEGSDRIRAHINLNRSLLG